jgi:hypothetical protein
MYKIYRSVWDASTYTWLQEGQLLATQSGTSFTDNTIPVSINSYTGATRPAMCTYTYIEYFVQAYNTGVGATSDSRFFQGNADGSTPWQVICP